MSDASNISVILDPLILIFNALRSVNWSFYFSWAFRIASLPVRLILIPLSFLANILFVLFSPALYILGYIYGAVTAILSFLASLEPLYTFFGAAASVGIVAGLTLAFSSTILTSLLGMHDTSSSSSGFRRPRRKGHLEHDTDATSDDDARDYDQASDDTPSSSANEKEWQWLDPSPSRRRPASGLLSQTILEEEDDSDQM